MEREMKGWRKIGERKLKKKLNYEKVREKMKERA